MARARPKMDFPLCEAQIACDADPIRTGREMCVKCETAIERRNKIVKQLKALKGEHYNQTEEAKRMKHG